MCSPSAPNECFDSGAPVSQRFPKSRRLRKRAEFQRVYEQGRRIRSSLFTAHVRDAETADPGRVGLTVPRAIGKAVVRNRVKRRLREAVRRHWLELPDGLEVVFHARRPIVDASWPRLESEVQRAFQAVQNASASQHGAKRRQPGRTP